METSNGKPAGQPVNASSEAPVPTVAWFALSAVIHHFRADLGADRGSLEIELEDDESLEFRSPTDDESDDRLPEAGEARLYRRTHALGAEVVAVLRRRVTVSRKLGTAIGEMVAGRRPTDAVNGHQKLTHLGHEDLTHPGGPRRVALTS